MVDLSFIPHAIWLTFHSFPMHAVWLVRVMAPAGLVTVTVIVVVIVTTLTIVVKKRRKNNGRSNIQRYTIVYSYCIQLCKHLNVYFSLSLIQTFFTCL